MHQYVKNPAFNLYQRAEFAGLAYSDGDELEHRIHDTVRQARDLGTFSPELADAIADWPSEYHLSRQRHCLVRPLGIRAGDRVLELGGGCGAITRFLGEIGAEVTTVEGSVQRARIAAERCRDLPNVKVVADDLVLFHTDERFDWVLLIGVLEYAPMFSAEQDPVHHYLTSVTKFLAPRGRIVIAIENKLGLKYFNGCNEDHLGVPFVGVQGLYGAKTPRTFGHQELDAQVRAAGMDQVEFLYPFPDYKLPSILLSEAALSDPLFNAADLLALTYARDYGGSRYRLFDEKLALREIVANGLLGALSNSFVVVASRQSGKRILENTLAVAYAVQRIAEFTTQTRFVREGGDIRVLKEPLLPDVPRKRVLADGSVLENVLGEAKYASGHLSIWHLWEARAKGGNFEQVVDAFEPWFSFLVEKAKAFSERQGRQKNERHNFSRLMLPGSDLDLTPFNLIEGQKKLVPIDREWKLDRAIPLGWVVARGVRHPLSAFNGFEGTPIKISEVIEALGTRHKLTVSLEKIDEWFRSERELLTIVTGRPIEKLTTAASSRNELSVYQQVTQLVAGSAELKQGLVASSHEVEALKAIVADREERAASLDRALTARSDEVEALKAIVADREERAASLDRALTARSDEVEALKAIVADREERAASLDRSLTARSDEVEALKAIVADREERAASLDRALTARSHEVEALKAIVADREERAASLDRALTARSDEVEALKAIVADREERAASLDRALTARSDEVEALKAIVADREERAASLDRALTARSDEVEALKAIVADREERAASLDRALTARTHEVEAIEVEVADLEERAAALDEALTVRTHEVEVLKVEVVARDNEIEAFKAVVADREERAAGLAQALVARHNEIEAFKAVVADRELQIQLSQSTIAAIHASTSWRIVAPLRLFKRLAQQLSTVVRYSLTLGGRISRKGLFTSPRDRRAIRIIEQSGLFDRRWYVEKNPDVVARRIDPVQHYVIYGAREGRDPSPSFSTRDYLMHHPDLAMAGINPLAHFVLHPSGKDLNAEVIGNGGEIALSAPRLRQAVLTLARRIYRALPLQDQKTKLRLRSEFFRYFGFLLPEGTADFAAPLTIPQKRATNPGPLDNPTPSLGRMIRPPIFCRRPSSPCMMMVIRSRDLCITFGSYGQT